MPHISVNDNAKDRHVDPTNEQNLSSLKNIMKKQKCDFGIALDGDADRVVLINGDFRR